MITPVVVSGLRLTRMVRGNLANRIVYSSLTFFMLIYTTDTIVDILDNYVYGYDLRTLADIIDVIFSFITPLLLVTYNIALLRTASGIQASRARQLTVTIMLVNMIALITILPSIILEILDMANVTIVGRSIIVAAIDMILYSNSILNSLVYLLRRQILRSFYLDRCRHCIRHSDAVEVVEEADSSTSHDENDEDDEVARLLIDDAEGSSIYVTCNIPE